MLYRLAIVYNIIACATALPTGRIVGGDNATVGQFPHQVSLQINANKNICGGTILDERFLLTAAHCVVVGYGIEPYPAHTFTVRVGSIIFQTAGELYRLKAIIVNQEYADFLNDVALLVTEKPIYFTNNIKPIALATKEVPPGEDVIVSGWGSISTEGPSPNQLKWNTLKALSTEQCQTAIQMGYESLLCLGHEPENGVCFGDSGGPAIYNNEVVGIAGFIVNGCGTQYPDGYAKVFYHREWILNSMQDYREKYL